MKMELKTKKFANASALCDFVNKNGITKGNIQSVSTDRLDFWILCYWTTEE